MDDAASGGHLAVMRWLHENRSEGCSSHGAMDDAASGGHLAVVEWLHATYGASYFLECIPSAMNNAARKGHLAVLEWLHANFPVNRGGNGITHEALDYAAGSGQLE